MKSQDVKYKTKEFKGLDKSISVSIRRLAPTRRRRTVPSALSGAEAATAGAGRGGSRALLGPSRAASSLLRGIHAILRAEGELQRVLLRRELAEGDERLGHLRALLDLRVRHAHEVRRHGDLRRR